MKWSYFIAFQEADLNLNLNLGPPARAVDLQLFTSEYTVTAR